MKRLEVNSKRLNNGDVAVEMAYNQQNRTKKLILFFIIAIIVGAIAFSACFFALEISRTNAYNNRLNNSIVQPEPETPPEIINPTTPENNPTTDDNNEPGGSASDESETGGSSMDNNSGKYDLVVQVVFGGGTQVYSLQEGIEHARQSGLSSAFGIGGWDTGVDTETKYVDVWRGEAAADFETGNPTYSRDIGTSHGDMKDYIWKNYIGNHAIAFKKGAFGDDLAENWKLELQLAATMDKVCVLAFMYMDANGGLVTLRETAIKAYETGVLNLGEDFYLNQWYAMGVRKIYAVITTQVSIKVNDSINSYTLSGYDNVIGNFSYSSQVDPNLYISILNCVVSTNSYGTLIACMDVDGTMYPVITNWTLKSKSLKSNFNKDGHTYTCSSFEDEQERSAYLITSKLGEEKEFTFANLLDMELEEITIKWIYYNVDITNGGTTKTYKYFTSDHLEQALKKLSANGKAVIHGDTFDEISYTGDGSQTISINGYCYNSRFSTLNKLIVDSNARNFRIYSCGTIDSYGNMKDSNGNYLNINISASANISKINNYGTRKIIFKGTSNSSQTTTITLYNLYSDNIPLIETSGDHNFKVKVSASLLAGKYYVVKSTNSGYNSSGNNVKYLNGRILGTGEEGEYLTYIIIDNILLISSYVGDNEDGSNNDGTYSFVWMLNQEMANGSLTGYYLLKNDITIPAGKDTDGNGTLDYYFQGFGNARVTSGAGPFKGTFDGGGYKVTIGWDNMGLFNAVGEGAVIKNLVLDGTVTKGHGDGNQHLENGSPKYDAAGNPVWDYYRFYGLAMQTQGNVSIINVYNNLKIYSYTHDADSNKIEYPGSETTFVALNYGTLNFVNCVASFFPIDDDGSGYVKSSYVGANWSGGVLNFTNCVAAARNFTPKNSNNKVGSFLGWDKNSSIKTSFTNCYKLVILDNMGTTLDYIPIIGGVGSGDKPTSAVLDSSLANVNKEYTSLSEVYTYLNAYVESNSVYINGSVSQRLFYWDNNYIRIWDSIADATALKNLCNGTDMSYRSAHITGSITVTDWTGFETFLGLLDGLGNTITFGANCSQGLIKNNGGTVKNLNTAGTITTSSNYVGAIAGTNTAGEGYYIQSGVISKCINNATITGNNNYIGGIAGAGKNIDSCINNGNVTGNQFVGGIVGIQEDFCEIESCKNTGEIIGKVNVGGIAGSAYYISSCTNEGNIKCTYAGRDNNNIGGLVGMLFESSSRNGNRISGTSAGTIEVTGYSYLKSKNIGGVVGYIGSGDDNVSGLNYCTVTVKIQATYCSWIGGIVGYSSKPISNAIFNGTINAINSSNIGGICGSSNGDITNCKVFVKDNIEPSITAANSTYIAGISGYSSGDITNCVVGDNSIDIYNKVIVADDNCDLVVGICVGHGASKTITDCYVYGSIESNSSNTSGITYLYSVENCVFNGNIIVNNVASISEGLTLISNSGNVTSVVFNGYVCDANNKASLHSGTTQGVKITTKTATRCFVLSEQTNILFTPKNADGSTISGVSYTGCSTFKDIQNSLVYNGLFFGHLDDALSESETTYWKIQLNGLIYDERTLNERQTTLTILDIDNLNSINDCVSNTNYEFTENFIFKDGLIIENFAGLGFDAKPMKMDDSSDGFITNDGTIANIYLNNACVFNNINNAKINNITTHLQEGTITNYSLIKNAANCTVTNCINFANITGTSSQEKIGGFVAETTNCLFQNCENYGNIVGGQFQKYIGGIVGQDTGGSFIGCINKGNISTNASSVDLCYMGGIIGISRKNSTITTCSNYGDILNGKEVGGIVGGIHMIAENTVTIKNCYINCKMSGLYEVGGIVGYISNNSGAINITNCITEGIIVSNGSIGRTGGIVGSSNAAILNITNCVSFAVLDNPNSIHSVAGIAQSLCGVCRINNSYFFGDFISSNYYVIANIGFDNIFNCGYNINNDKAALNRIMEDERLNWYVSCWGEEDDALFNVYYKTEINTYVLATTLDFYRDKNNLYYKNTRDEYVYISNIDDLVSNYLLWVTDILDLEAVENYEDVIDLSFPELTYARDTNPVWSSSAYIKLLFKTETESMLDGTNTKLTLNWFDTNTSTTGTQTGFDDGFWNGVFAE